MTGTVCARRWLHRKRPLKPGLRDAALAADGAALVLYTLQLSNAYAMMLLIMSYYSGFFFAIVVGLAVGQLLFLRPPLQQGAAKKGPSGDVSAFENVDPCCPIDDEQQRGAAKSDYMLVADA